MPKSDSNLPIQFNLTWPVWWVRHRIFVPTLRALSFRRGNHLKYAANGLRSESNNSPIQLSFCTAYRNRFQQMTQTLPINLKDSEGLHEKIEFVIAQYGGECGLEAWLTSHYPDALRSGLIRFIQKPDTGSFHYAKAKNLAHRHARGRYLVNLDCDNFLGPDGAHWLLARLSASTSPTVLWQFSGKLRDGSCGRITMSRHDFDLLGGYDEEFVGFGYEDIDLIERAKSLGLKVERVDEPSYNKAIKNPLGMGLKKRPFHLRLTNWRNQWRSFCNIAKGNWRVNH